MLARERSDASRTRRFGRRRPSEALPPTVPPTVLIVDDVEAIRVLLRTALEPEFTVVGEAEDGAQAVSSVLSLRPDLVILDLNMPRHDGLEAIRAIRAAPGTTRVVVLTGLAPGLIEDKVIALGASRFVDKSAPLADLPRVLHEALASA